MKKKYTIVLVIALFAAGCYLFPNRKDILEASTSAEKLRQDFTVFRNVLEKGHPSLYTYTPKEEMDGYFDSIYSTLTAAADKRSFHNKLSFIISKIGCTHTNLSLPTPYYDTLQQREIFFPAPVMYVDGGLYINSDMWDIPVGAHIISINGNTADDIMSRILYYNVPDGKNRTYSLSQAADNFAYDYFLAYGSAKNFLVEYAEPGDTVNKKNSVNATSLKKHQTDYDYNTYYSFPQEVGYDFEIIDSLHTAVMKLRSFSYNTAPSFTAYKNFINNSFTLLKSQPDIDNLIIDCRNNVGGEYENIFLLYRFLSRRAFNELDSAFVRFNTTPYEEYLDQEYKLTERPYLDSMISRDFKPVNKQYLALKMEENTLRRPHPMAFEGNLYVITNSNVVSAASNFVAMIKDSKRGFIIGEETGGGYNSHNGFTHVLYNLPNTRIQLEFSAVKVKHFLTNPQLNKYGVQPDFSVSTTLQDILNNKDPQIEYIFQTLLEKRE